MPRAVRGSRRPHAVGTYAGLGWPIATAMCACPMETQQSHRIVATLEHMAGAGADGLQIADCIVQTWQTIVAALTPIIGQRSVATLYKRSFYLASRQHPWLMDVHEGMQTSMDLATLKSRLLEHGSAEAAAAGGAALQMFHELLTNLLGSSLTERLLRSVWADLLPAPAQDDPA